MGVWHRTRLWPKFWQLVKGFIQASLLLEERESLEWREVVETPICFRSEIFVNGTFVKVEIRLSVATTLLFHDFGY